VKEISLYPYDSDAGNYAFWDKVGQIVGSLIELKTLIIHVNPYIFENEDRPDWEILNRILPCLRLKVALYVCPEDYYAEVEEIQGLARVIHGHPMISGFSSDDGFIFYDAGPWCSTLATIPYLERVTLRLAESETGEQSDLVHFELLTKLLRAPALRFVRFDGFYFTDELCHSTASALEEGSSIIDIIFEQFCVFPDGGRAIIANALKKNATVTNVEFLDDCDESFCNTLAALLLCNTPLQSPTLCAKTSARRRWLSSRHSPGEWFSSIFLSLGLNTTLKSLTAKIGDEFGDELCAAITSGLAKNTTLEELELYDMFCGGDDGALSARNALSFLRTNSTLKSLRLSFMRAQNKSYVSTFQLEAVKMMADNPFLRDSSLQPVTESNTKNCL
jgi:hypothetical protein